MSLTASDVVRLRDRPRDPVQAACLIMTGTTAFQALHRAGVRWAAPGSGTVLTKTGTLQPHMKVLIHGCAGGTGSMLAVLCRLAGIPADHVYGTCSREKFSFVGPLGVGHPMDYKGDEDWATLAPAGGVDIVLDAIGGDYVDKSLRWLAPGGRYVSYGFTSSASPGLVSVPFVISHFAKIFWQQHVMWWWNRKQAVIFGGVTKKGETEGFRDDLLLLLELLDRGELCAAVGKVVPLAEVPAALQSIHDMKHVGKVVVVVDEALEQQERLAGRISL